MIFKNTLSNSKSGLKCKIYLTQKIYMYTENCDQFHVPLLIFSHSRKTSSPPFAFPECRSTRQITNSFNDSAKGKLQTLALTNNMDTHVSRFTVMHVLFQFIACKKNTKSSNYFYHEYNIRLAFIMNMKCMYILLLLNMNNKLMYNLLLS